MRTRIIMASFCMNLKLDHFCTWTLNILMYDALMLILYVVGYWPNTLLILQRQ